MNNTTMMTVEEVKNLMKSSKTMKEWDDNCDEVKRRCNGYPDFWYREIILSSLLSLTREQYGW